MTERTDTDELVKYSMRNNKTTTFTTAPNFQEMSTLRLVTEDQSNVLGERVWLAILDLPPAAVVM
jgi:hypothetical protein